MIRDFLRTVILACLLTPTAWGAEPADLVIMDGRIWSDGRIGFASFAAIDDGRFIYVGDTNLDYIGGQTQIIHAEGQLVLPGLIDAHVHMLGGGRGLGEVQLRAATSRIDFVNRVAEWVETLKKDQWILGGRWSTESWPSVEQPTKDWLDDGTGDHPAYLPRMDGHSALVNSRALELAGIDASGPDNPVGGVIDRDPTTNEPTGILRESAMSLVNDLIPETNLDDDLAALQRAIDEALRHGITAVCDIPLIEELPVYTELAKDNPRIRFYLYPTASDWAAAVDTVTQFDAPNPRIQIRGLKAYLDGSLGSRTAMMHGPFCNNEPGREQWAGLWREGVEDGTFARNVRAAHAAGLQTIVHAIGDEANHFLLDTLDDAYPDLAAARCRSEHAQHLLKDDIARFGTLGVIASMQPFHKADDGRYAEQYIGPDRTKTSYAYKSLLDAGAVLAFGSDWPVVTINPFLGMEAAVTGRILTGETWQTQENITVAEALRAYTSAAAYSAFAEDEIGKIEVGHRADFVILNASVFGDAVEWAKIAPVAVYVDGERVYAGEKAPRHRGIKASREE